MRALICHSAKDLRIDTGSIDFESRVKLNTMNSVPVEATTGAGASMARESYKSRR